MEIIDQYKFAGRLKHQPAKEKVHDWSDFSLNIQKFVCERRETSNHSETRSRVDKFGQNLQVPNSNIQIRYSSMYNIRYYALYVHNICFNFMIFYFPPCTHIPVTPAIHPCRFEYEASEDAMSCRCATGYGANLLGKCVPEAGPLQARWVED